MYILCPNTDIGSLHVTVIQVTTLDPIEIIETLKNNQKCREIMLSRGDSLAFAVKCKLVLFPENIFALWISIAVRYFRVS